MSDQPASGHLEAILRAITSIDRDVDLRQSLYRLVDAVIENTAADRAAVLLRDGDELVPTAVAARRVNRDLFLRFRSMQPVPLVGARRDAIEAGKTVVVHDPVGSGIVPDDWVAAFGSNVIVLAPVRSGHESIAVFALDYTKDQEPAPSDVAALELFSELVRIAIDVDRSRAATRRADATRAAMLTTSQQLFVDEPLPVRLRRVAEAVAMMLPSRRCAISVECAGTALEVEAGGERAAREEGDRFVFPLRHGQMHYGYLAVTGGGRLSAEDLRAVEVCAHQGALLLDQHRHRDEAGARIRRAEVLLRVADIEADNRRFRATLDRLNRELCVPVGFECTEVVFRQRRLVELVGGRLPDAEEARLFARMSTERDPLPVRLSAKARATPIVVNFRLIGLLLSRSASSLHPDSTETELLRAIASALGDAASRVRLRAELRAAERRADVHATREALRKQFDESAGRTLAEIGRRLAFEAAGALPNTPLRDRLTTIRALVSQCLLEAHRVAAELATMGLDELGLHLAVRSLLASCPDDVGSGYALRVEHARGDSPAEIDPDIEECAFGATFDAVTLVSWPGRPTTVTVTISYGDSLVVTVRDDGIGLSQRSAGEMGPGAHYALGAIRERLAAVGGRVAVEAADPRGVQVRISVPVRAPIAQRLRT